MTKQEFKRVYKASQEPQNMTDSEKDEAIVALGGIAYGTDRRLATVKQTSWWIRYHCLQFNNVFDMQELENHQIYFRKVDLLD